MKYYKQEIQKIIKPFKLGEEYLGWKFNNIIFDKVGPFALQRIIFRFIKQDNEFFLFFRLNKGQVDLSNQFLKDDSNIVKITDLFRKRLLKNKKLIQESLFVTFFTPKDEKFFSRLNNFAENELLDILNFKNYEIINNKTSLRNDKKPKQLAKLAKETQLELANLLLFCKQKNNNYSLEKVFEVIWQILNFENSDIDKVKCVVFDLLGIESDDYKNDAEFLAFFNNNFNEKIDRHILPYLIVKKFLNKDELKGEGKKMSSNYEAIVGIDFNLEAYGIGDFFRKNRNDFLNSQIKNRFLVSDAAVFFEGNSKVDRIYNDLELCFQRNNIQNKKVLILDYSKNVDFLQPHLKNSYFLYLYYQYFNLLKFLGFVFEFKKFLDNPEKGIETIIEKLNKETNIDINVIDNQARLKNKSYIVNGEINKKIKQQIKQDKKVIGISANYIIDFPQEFKKGWRPENWKNSIKLLNESYDNLQFVLLPVNQYFFYDFDEFVSNVNYHYKIFKEMGNKYDILYLDNQVREYVKQKETIDDEFLTFNDRLEYLKTATSYCDLVIALDSGPAHIAASLDVPVVSLFSNKGKAIIFKPNGNNSFALFKIFKDQKLSEDYLNVNEITPQEVVSFIKSNNLIR